MFKYLFLLIPLGLIVSALKIDSIVFQNVHYECSDPIDIIDAQFKIKKGEIYIKINKKIKPNNINFKENFELPKSDESFFMAYLINSSNNTVNALKQDGSLIIVQEALNENGEWQAIERWDYSGCGNSYMHSLSLEPDKYVKIAVKQYFGNYKTKLRLKMTTENDALFSDIFKGSIDKSQFQQNVEIPYEIRIPSSTD